MNANPGTYALVLQTDKSTAVQVGRWGILNTQPGYYIYVGSAFGPGGVQARVSRHCRGSKSKHWHIDYLREFASLLSVWYCHQRIHLEHRWAKALMNWEDTESIKGFGCSDCSCKAHLFFARTEPNLADFADLQGCSVQLLRLGDIYNPPSSNGR